MRQRELAVLMNGLSKLTRTQRQMVVAELTAGEHKVASIEVIEGGASDHLCCPHCAAERVIKYGSVDGLQRYKCQGCRKSFNALTGTPLARLRMKGKWLEQAAVLRDGLSLTKAMERLNVSRPTAFRWRHRFLALPKTVQAQALTGIVEGDETFFLRSSKGQRQGLGRTPRKRGGKAEKRGTSKEQVPVLVARDRSGNTADFILDSDDADHIVDALKPILATDAIFCSDGSKAMAAAARKMKVAHRPVNLSAGIRVIGGVYHVQNVNAYDSRLKDWLRRFKGVATRYLDSYLGWHRAIDRMTGGSLNPASLLAMAVRV
ncbi:MAG: IS1595 family transposase [Sulfuricellaceae bacterium]|nr:IS1595 family transposase [Sulfuricellaceae bacterium]